MEYGILTKCLYGNGKKLQCDKSGALSFPIYQSATFAHYGVGEGTGYDYSRMQNPTRQQLEHVISSLEQGSDAFAFSSGMAAISAVMELFHPGDHIITDKDLYGGSRRLFHNINEKNGIEFSHIDFQTEMLEDFILEHTKAILIETPSNPMMGVIDIYKTAEIAKKYGILLIVDNTFLSPYFQNPLSLGADIVVHSGTKFLGGHNDTLAGFAVTNSDEIAQKLRFILKTTGAGLAPFDSWLILRGIKTLGLRMEKSMQNAIGIVEWLQKEKKVSKVYYPGLKDNLGYEVCKKQSRGFGSMITFEVNTKETALSILNKVSLIHFAESLGGVETLITYPITQTHADLSQRDLESNGITDKILRLSVGIEDIKDLICELEFIFK